jgi:hypothetical protein
MGADVVECLCCGSQRLIGPAEHHHGDCPRCGYVGWAPAAELSEHTRRALRDRPVESRRLHITAA